MLASRLLLKGSLFSHVCKESSVSSFTNLLDIEDLDYIRQFDSSKLEEDKKEKEKENKRENPHQQILTGCTQGIIDEPYYEVVKKIH